jgi:hypothetical protein
VRVKKRNTMENHNSDYATISQSESSSWATHTKKKFGKRQDEHAMQCTTSVTALFRSLLE